MRKDDVIVCLIWIILAMLIIFQSIRLKLGQLNYPGPGFLPFCSGLILGLLALILLIFQVSPKKGSYQTKIEGFQLGKKWTKAAYLMVSSFIYIFFFWENLGYLISTAIFLFFILKIVASQSLKRSALFSAATTIVSFIIFQTWLQCQLPKGLLKGLNF